MCVSCVRVHISVIHYANLSATTLATQRRDAASRGSKEVTLWNCRDIKSLQNLLTQGWKSTAKDSGYPSASVSALRFCLFVFLCFFFIFVIVRALSRLYYYDVGYDNAVFTFLRFYFSATTKTTTASM